MTDYGADLFKGTAWYYSKYRPLYPSSLIRFLVNKFSLNGEGRLLDLGCGTGQLALRFNDWFEETIGRAEDRATDWGYFRLIIIAKAFHWMDREPILEILYNSCDDNGGIAIIDNNNEKQKPLLWKIKVNELVKSWLGDERRAGNSTYIPPIQRFEDTVAKSSFRDVERHVLPSYSYTWTVDSIIGNLYSTSFASKRLFGDNLERFESDLKSALLDIDSTGVFTEELSVSVITAIKK